MTDKPLSEKEFHSLNGDKRAFYKEDVKKAVKKLKEELINRTYSPSKYDTKEIINKIFGEFKWHFPMIKRQKDFG